jgi:hypothetical protein
MRNNDLKKLTGDRIISGEVEYNFDDWLKDLAEKVKVDFSAEALEMEEGSEQHEFWLDKFFAITFGVCYDQAQSYTTKKAEGIFKEITPGEFFDENIKSLIPTIKKEYKHFIDILRGIMLRDFTAAVVEGLSEKKAAQLLDKTYQKIIADSQKQNFFLR